MRAHFVFIHFVRNNVVGGWCGGDGVNDFFFLFWVTLSVKGATRARQFWA